MIKFNSFMLTCEFSRFLKKPLNKIKGFENTEGIPTVEDFFEDDYYQAEDLLKIVAAAFEEGYKAKNKGKTL